MHWLFLSMVSWTYLVGLVYSIVGVSKGVGQLYTALLLSIFEAFVNI